MQLISVLLCLAGLTAAAGPILPKYSYVPSCPASNNTHYVAATGSHYLVECGIDRSGIDMSINPAFTGSFAECLEHCARVRHCRDVSYIPETGACHQKATYGPPRENGVNAWGGLLVDESGEAAAAATAAALLNETVAVLAGIDDASEGVPVNKRNACPNYCPVTVTTAKIFTVTETFTTAQLFTVTTAKWFTVTDAKSTVTKYVAEPATVTETVHHDKKPKPKTKTIVEPIYKYIPQDRPTTVFQTKYKPTTVYKTATFNSTDRKWNGRKTTSNITSVVPVPTTLTSPSRTPWSTHTVVVTKYLSGYEAPWLVRKTESASSSEETTATHNFAARGFPAKVKPVTQITTKWMHAPKSKATSTPTSTSTRRRPTHNRVPDRPLQTTNGTIPLVKPVNGSIPFPVLKPVNSTIPMAPGPVIMASTFPKISASKKSSSAVISSSSSATMTSTTSTIASSANSSSTVTLSTKVTVKPNRQTIYSTFITTTTSGPATASPSVSTKTKPALFKTLTPTKPKSKPALFKTIYPTKSKPALIKTLTPPVPAKFTRPGPPTKPQSPASPVAYPLPTIFRDHDRIWDKDNKGREGEYEGSEDGSQEFNHKVNDYTEEKGGEDSTWSKVESHQEDTEYEHEWHQDIEKVDESDSDSDEDGLKEVNRYLMHENKDLKDETEGLIDDNEFLEHKVERLREEKAKKEAEEKAAKHALWNELSAEDEE